MYGMADKYERIGRGPNPFIDPDGYRQEVDAVETLFRAVLERQEAESAAAGRP
jgi:hypothetical protein